jgi:hypothetical protein
MADKPMSELDEGSKGRRGFTLVVLIVIGLAGKNVAPNTAQLNTGSPAASGSQNP